VSSVTDMSSMFEGATSYNPPPGRGLGERKELGDAEPMMLG
jgi:hypothetical protein